jgi:hypothetical protein
MNGPATSDWSLRTRRLVEARSPTVVCDSLFWETCCGTADAGSDPHAFIWFRSRLSIVRCRAVL